LLSSVYLSRFQGYIPITLLVLHGFVAYVDGCTPRIEEDQIVALHLSPTTRSLAWAYLNSKQSVYLYHESPSTTLLCSSPPTRLQELTLTSMLDFASTRQLHLLIRLYSWVPSAGSSFLCTCLFNDYVDGRELGGSDARLKCRTTTPQSCLTTLVVHMAYIFGRAASLPSVGSDACAICQSSLIRQAPSYRSLNKMEQQAESSSSARTVS